MKRATLIFSMALLLLVTGRLAQADSQGSGTINGVVSAQGKPVAGAKVELLKSDGPLSRNDKILGKKEHFTSISSTTTDDDGNFSFQFDNKATYRINAIKKGQGHSGTTVTLAKGETIKVTLELKGKPTTSGDEQN